MIIPSEFAKRLAAREKKHFWQLSFLGWTSLASTLLLAVPVVFWFSQLLKLGMGTDFVVDVYYHTIRQTGMGTVVAVLLLIILPMVSLGLNIWWYKREKYDELLLWAFMSGLATAGGVFALIKL